MSLKQAGPLNAVKYSTNDSCTNNKGNIFWVILLFKDYEINQHLAESKGPNTVVVFI